MHLFVISLPSVFWHLAEHILSVSLELEEIVMVLPEGVSVTHSDKGDSNLLHVSVQVSLDVDAHSAGALVQDCVGRLVVNQTGHRDSLLLSATQHIIPIVELVPSTFSGHEVTKTHFVQNRLQILLY